MPESVITTIGAKHICARAVFSEWEGYVNWRLSLFTNDVTPTVTSVPSEFDVNGMTPNNVEMLQEAWLEPVAVGSYWRSYWGESATTFTAIMESVTVYGYFLRDPFYNFVVWSQLFDAPVPLVAGQSLLLRPYFQFKQCP
jgi:hypothetical protein